MRVGLILPPGQPERTAEIAVDAENRGYDSVWKSELWGEDAFVALGEVATRTSDIRLGTAIVNVFSRTPAVLAMGARTLDRVSDGRARLGVGSSTPKVIEDLHGMAFERPVARIRETVELVRAFLGRDGIVEYDGEVFSVADFPAIGADIPIYNAALGPANRQVTGVMCDGWLPNNIPFSHFASAFETIGQAASDAGRDPDDVEVAPWIHVAIDDARPERAKDLVCRTVAYYVGSAEGYRRAVGAAYPAEAAKIAEAWRSGDLDRARAQVTDAMVADLGCAGRAADARAQLRAVIELDTVDVPLVNIPHGASPEIVERTIEGVAPKSL